MGKNIVVYVRLPGQGTIVSNNQVIATNFTDGSRESNYFNGRLLAAEDLQSTRPPRRNGSRCWARRPATAWSKADGHRRG